MKKLLSMMLIMASLVCFTSCSKDNFHAPQEVDLTLDYKFFESGYLTRGMGDDAYSEFYEKYIQTKQLTPSIYSLTFTNEETGATAQINGHWDCSTGIRLPEGRYKVEGTSSCIYNTNLDLHSEYVSDTVFISFSQNIQISPNQTNLVLNAQYDSYLLMFDAASVSSIEYSGLKRWPLKTHDNLITLFVNRLSTTSYSSSYNDYLEIKKVDGTVSKIYLKKFAFEKGKYYYFNNMTNSFDITKMESGN